MAPRLQLNNWAGLSARRPITIDGSGRIAPGMVSDADGGAGCSTGAPHRMQNFHWGASAAEHSMQVAI
jgi:hypothetical protein